VNGCLTGHGILVFDEKGNMYVLDVYTEQVVVLDKNFKKVAESYAADQAGITGGKMLSPTGMAVKGGKLYVADWKAEFINVYKAY
jgi:DNA-binding beta-propeller fold protein YncE